MQTPDQRLRGPLVRLTVIPGWVVVTAATLLFAAGFSLPLEYQFVPLVASIVVFGLPHGAVDHLAPTRVCGTPVTPRSLLAVGVLYGVVGGLYAASWFVTPVAAFALFILITWLHWGQGEIHALTALLGVDHLTGPGQRLLAALARGTLPMLVPLVFFPEQYRFVVETVVGLFGAWIGGPAAAVFTESGRLVVAALVAVLLVATLSLGLYRAEQRRDWVVDAGEILLLVSFFAMVPPILAIGLFFTWWHALRHVGRLLALDPEACRRLDAGRYGRTLGRFARDAAPLTAASLLFLGLFYVLVPVRPGGISEWTGLYLVLIAALTLPHVLIVAYLDHVQDVWTGHPVALLDQRRNEARNPFSSQEDTQELPRS